MWNNFGKPRVVPPVVSSRYEPQEKAGVGKKLLKAAVAAPLVFGALQGMNAFGSMGPAPKGKDLAVRSTLGNLQKPSEVATMGVSTFTNNAIKETAPVLTNVDVKASPAVTELPKSNYQPPHKPFGNFLSPGTRYWMNMGGPGLGSYALGGRKNTKKRKHTTYKKRKHSKQTRKISRRR